MQKFDESKLRDPQLRAKFYKKLAEIRSVQRRNTFIDYATNQNLFDELVAIYEQNLQEYETFYVQNCLDYKREKKRVDEQKDKIHPSRFAEMLGLRRKIEDCLNSEVYTENQKASGYIRELSERLEAYIEEMAQWKQELVQVEKLLESSKNDIWEEDLLRFQQACNRLKSGILGDQLPSQREDALPTKLAEARKARSTAFQEVLDRLNSLPSLKKRVAALQSKELSLQVFEKLQTGVGLFQKMRKWAFAGLASLGLMGMILIGLEAPGWIHRYLMKKDYEEARNLHSYDSYQDFIERYQEGTYVIAAKEAQAQLTSGKISTYSDPQLGNFSFEGELKNGKPHGTGKGLFSSGGQYNGDWAEGLFSGEGSWENGKGERYTGSWKAGKKEGKGTYQFADGTRYEGMWKEDAPRGQGRRYLTDGSVYSGWWEGGQLNGEGTWKDGKGNRYEGNWKAGQFHGKGTYFYKDGKNYSGTWNKNLRHGKGMMRWENGAIFVGTWIGGYISGQGSFTSRFRESYEGKFMEDSTGYISVVNSSDSLLQKGVFQDGLFVKAP